MARPELNLDQQLVSCEICLKSIPLSEAKSAEAEDYVAYFCGLDCYDIWKQQQGIGEEPVPDRNKPMPK